MAIPNRKLQMLDRLQAKQLDTQFHTLVHDGLSCSKFEAQAVVQVVREVYGPFLGQAPAAMMPGSLSLMAVDADEPCGKPIAACRMLPLTLHLHRGAEDDRLILEQGAQAFRRARLADLCQEALSQGALLTREDLACRIFFVSLRTISRDLAWQRQTEPDRPLPLRSTLHDIGPVLTHREQIVRLALQGRGTAQICQFMHHSPAAVANYLSTFSRCAFLKDEGLQPGQIAYLVKRGKGLVLRYLKLLEECREDRNMAFHLDQLKQLGQPGGGKKPGHEGGAGHGQ
jgi:hypothetical protein